MEMNPIGWIEIPATDLDRAEKFYSEYFGHDFDRKPEKNGFTMSWFPMDMNVYGAATTLIKGKDYIPSHTGTLIYFNAPGESLSAAIEKAEKQNITIITPLTDVGEHGFYAALEDSEGNKIAIHSMKG